MATHRYTDEEDAQIRRLHADGLGCTRIARELGSDFTKNMMINRCRTLKLVGKSADLQLGGDRRREKRAHVRIRPPLKPLPSLAAVIPEATQGAPPSHGHASQERHRCQWRINDTRPYLWCDKPCTTRPGLGGSRVWSSYCEHHHRICWQPAPRYRQTVDA